MRMAWKLHRDWNIPAEALIAPPRARAKVGGVGERRRGWRGYVRGLRLLSPGETAHRQHLADRCPGYRCVHPGCSPG
jgi:hypothetical protein